MNEETRHGFFDLMSDFATETAMSFRAMSLPAKIIFSVGFVGFLVFDTIPFAAIPPTLLAVLRAVCFIAFIIGAIANARCVDEFYRSVHLYACAIALPAAAILIYTTGVFGIDLGRAIIAYIVTIWFIGFVCAFARLRHA
jgi:hypothetical protein